MPGEGDTKIGVNIELLPKEAVIEVYRDALSPTAKQIGKFGEDAAKAARLLTAPLQLMAAAQDRFAAMCERIAKRVPEEERVEPPAEIVGPTIDRLKYLPDDNPLSKMFEEVLTKSMDKRTAGDIHPAFPSIISQLSRDEGWIVYRLSSGNGYGTEDHMDYDPHSNRFSNRVVTKIDFPTNELYLPDQIDLYLLHLQTLGIASWDITRQQPIMAVNIQTGVRRDGIMQLTEFGKIFANAAIDQDGFESFKKKT